MFWGFGQGWGSGFFEVFGGVFAEFFVAGGAAEFDLLALVDDDFFVAHGAEVVVGDDAGFERVGFDRGFGGGRGHGGGEGQDEQDGRDEAVDGGHGF